MAGYKAASGKPKPRNLKRTVDGEEIKPCLYINCSLSIENNILTLGI